ncbi:hypothetical protein ABVT39_001122 [Epinephelus coioides]
MSYSSSHQEETERERDWCRCCAGNKLLSVNAPLKSFIETRETEAQHRSEEETIPGRSVEESKRNTSYWQTVPAVSLHAHRHTPSCCGINDRKETPVRKVDELTRPSPASTSNILPVIFGGSLCS